MLLFAAVCCYWLPAGEEQCSFVWREGKPAKLGAAARGTSLLRSHGLPKVTSPELQLSSSFL